MTSATARRDGAPAVSARGALLDVSRFDRGAPLLAQERAALAGLDMQALRRNASVGVPRRTASQWRALSRLVEPLDTARGLLHHSGDERFPRAGRPAAAIVLANCAALGRCWWGWTATDWARLAGASRAEFKAAQPLPTEKVLI